MQGGSKRQCNLCYVAAIRGARVGGDGDTNREGTPDGLFPNEGYFLRDGLREEQGPAHWLLSTLQRL